MDVQLHRRAEIALRSLDGAGKRRVDTVISRMRNLRKQDVWRALRADKLQTGVGAERYSIRANDQIRLVASILGDALLVQDIVPYERLGQVLESKGL